MRLSVVIPVLDDDADALERLLTALGGMETSPDEVIVAATGSSGRAARLAKRFAARLVVETASRGARLDTGAVAASGDVLWFVHADAEPDRNAPAAIAAAIADGVESGCFRFTFTGPRRPPKILLETLVALRIRLGGMVYGDQGLFVTADAYRTAGGFARQPLFEEVRLIRALRTRGTFRALETPIGVSPRRWERDGWWRRTLHNRWLAACYMVGVPAATLAARYRTRTGAGTKNGR